MKEHVILVDENDVEIGTMPKLEVHQKGLLHRAFSIFIFNSQGEMLLQQRALKKYHSAGLWSNACCSHPNPKEEILVAANRRLMEEMGIKCNLQHVHSFCYRAKLENDLSEHEFDHVFLGNSNEIPIINKEEVATWKYISVAELLMDIEQNPKIYTEWFKICINDLLEKVDSVF